jgi:hypothetical protein
METKPTIVCLCGSTRFVDLFDQASLRETLAGKIVLSVGSHQRSDEELFRNSSPLVVRTLKRDLEWLHLRKIEMADEVYIINPNGYIGLSTCDELWYAAALGKIVRFLEVPDGLTLEQLWDEADPEREWRERQEILRGVL